MKGKAIDSRRLRGRKRNFTLQIITKNRFGKCSVEGSSLKKKIRPRDDQYLFS